jgi:transcriptional regulator with XRE-family HTH domain
MRQKTFAEKLKAWREFKGLTQREAALILDVSQRTLEGWETGKRQPSRYGLVTLNGKLGGRKKGKAK